MNLIFLIIKTIFCSNEHLISQNRFFIVTDMEIQNSLVEDKSHSDILTIANSQINLGSDYFWDIYFPKPFIYELNCEKIRSLTVPISFNLEGKTNKEELLFRFSLTYDIHNIYLRNFVDSDNVSITNALFSVEKHLNNIFMLSRKANNVENIKASYRYLTCAYKISPLYMEILHSLFQYILRIDNLTENVKNIGDDKIFSIISKAKISLTSISMTFIKNLSFVRFPIYRKLTDLPTKKKFEDEMIEIFRSLEDVVEIYLKNKNKGSREEIIIKRTDVLDHINNVLIQDDLLTKCFENYDKLLMDIKIIEIFVFELIDLKTTADLKGILDIRVKNIDKFIKNYRSLMLEYFEIMEKLNFENIFRHCFPKISSKIDLSIKKLEDFYVDKLIANKLYPLITHYNVDKTDFLIFSKTNYFAHIFSLRVMNNLELIRKVILIYDISDETKEKLTVEDSSNKLTLCDRILNAEKKWDRMLKDDKSNQIKSFNDLLKEEKRHVLIIDKSSHSSNTTEDQLTSINIAIEVPNQL